MNKAHTIATPIRQMEFTAYLDLPKLTKDARGYTTLVFINSNDSIDLSIKMEPEFGDLYDALNNDIRSGKLNSHSRVSVTIDQHQTNCFVDIEIINLSPRGGNVCHAIRGFASVSLYYPNTNKAA